MEESYRAFVSFVRKFPFGEKFLEYAGRFIGGMYLLWIAMMLIGLLGVIRGRKIKEIRGQAGFFLLLVIFGWGALFLYQFLVGHYQ